MHRIAVGYSPLSLETVLAQPIGDIDTEDVNGRTPLMWSAWRGNVYHLELFLSSRGDANRYGIEKKDNEGYTALARAAQGGHLQCVRKLLRAGARSDNSDAWNLQPLHHASGNKVQGFAIVQELLAWKAKANAESDCGTPLHLAANRGSKDTAKALLAAGADIDTINPTGDPPVLVALMCWNFEVFKYLSSQGAILDRPRKSGETIVHIAVILAPVEIWDLLITYAENGRLRNVDIRATHDAHDIYTCFSTCRKIWYTGERSSEIVELRKLDLMMIALKNFEE